MSKKAQSTVSGTPVVKNTAVPLVTEAGKRWALTVALQKTEWHNLKKSGVATKLLTLTDKKSGTQFVAVVFAIPTENLTADTDKFTFFVSGTDVDDLVAHIDDGNPVSSVA
jgi:hypothetical protein